MHPNEVILVLDGGVGQNALSQVELFLAVGVTGLVVSKLMARPTGVVFAIAQNAQAESLPIYLLEWVRQKTTRPFVADQFVQALLVIDTKSEGAE